MILRPSRLVQRCSLDLGEQPGEELIVFLPLNERAGRRDRQATIVRKMQERGLDRRQIPVTVFGMDRLVEVVAGKGFPFEQYRLCVSNLVARDDERKEPTHIRTALLSSSRSYPPPAYRTEEQAAEPTVNAWLDLTNGAFLTLKEDNALGIIAFLERSIPVQTKESANIKSPGR